MVMSQEIGVELARLAAVVLSEPDQDAALEALTRAALRVVPSADGCSITMRRDGRPTAPATSDDWATELDKEQFHQQEGPCVDCLREGLIVRSPDLGTDSRFPNYGPTARELGAASSLSLPMTADGRTVGALNFYSRTACAFKQEDLALGEVLAAHASLAVQVTLAYYANADLAGQMREAMASRAAIEQAKGILMAQYELTEEEAWRRLVDMSSRSNRKLRDLAEEIRQKPSQPL